MDDQTLMDNYALLAGALENPEGSLEARVEGTKLMRQFADALVERGYILTNGQWLKGDPNIRQRQLELSRAMRAGDVVQINRVRYGLMKAMIQKGRS